MVVPIRMSFESVDKCPVCGGQGQFDIKGKDPELGYEIEMYSCQVCNTSYQNPRMTQDTMIEYYKSGIYRSQPNRKLYEERVMARINLSVKLISESVRYKPKRSLDIGCSRGYLVRAIQEKFGCEALGYDVYNDPEAVIDIIQSKDQITGKFDLITCIHVLEHYADPMKELTWMADLLADNGMLMIEIPKARVITLPHPVTFTSDAVPIMMKHINAEYIYIDMQLIQIGIILAWKIKNEQ